MQVLLRRIATLFVLLFLGVGAHAQEPFDAGVDAYRAGDFAGATAAFTAALADPLTDADRARVYYNLGNTAWRGDRRGEALGWYAACLRLDPRHADARANRTFVREELGLAPLDAGDLAGTLGGWLSRWTRAEAAWFVLLAAALLFLAMVVEALRGGRAARWGVGVTALALVVSAAPWIAAERSTQTDPWIAIGLPEVSLRAEPRLSLPTIETVKPGEAVTYVDALGDSIRVETADGVRGWADASAFFRLRVD